MLRRYKQKLRLLGSGSQPKGQSLDVERMGSVNMTPVLVDSKAEDFLDSRSKYYNIVSKFEVSQSSTSK